ncbi:MAG: PucR family transcriptional regulator ligand-binding domain-containing protein [Kineosporiaceae bacterium]|nr:PucR family transcriptional regulator ligand-binding domain-containing protein [Kineosporiaceae bacterium]
MAELSVRELLAMPEVRKWRPEVVTGRVGLDHPVRWLHVAEVPDIAVMLRGGEAVITTGSLWPEDDEALAEYVTSLHGAGVSALFLALGRRYRGAPEAVVRTCRRRRIPLAVFHRPVPFVEITRAVQSLILHDRHAELTLSQQISDSFLGLPLTEVSIEEILSHAAQVAGCPVVLENLANRVIAAEGDDLTPGEALRDWDRLSRELPARPPGSTESLITESGWVITPVGARGVVWGRLILCGPRLPSDRAALVGQRAAQALAVQRLLHPARESWETAATAALLNDLLTGQDASTHDLAVRARAAGFPLSGRVFTPLVLRVAAPEVARRAGESASHQVQGHDGVARTLVQAVERAARGRSIPVLAAVHGPRTAAALVSATDRVPPLDPVRMLAVAVRARRELTGLRIAIGVGHPCASTSEVPASFAEAGHVADAALVAQPPGPFAQLADVHVRGLMGMLRGDPRLQGFVERELGPLLEQDAEDLLSVLRQYLFSHRNKSATANRSHMSRPALYRRLRAIQERLGVDLEDPERVISLQVALLALEARAVEY